MRSNNIAATKGSGWKQFKGEDFPPEAVEFFKTHDIWKYSSSWIFLYFKGVSPETATNWCVVMDNGGFFKVGAQWIIYFHGQSGQMNSNCVWTGAHLERTLRSLFVTGNTLPDPNYQT